MMDVYEHIAVEQRPELHDFLSDALAESARVFSSFPTPQHLKFLRECHPEEVQPIDEDVTTEVLERLASDVKGRLLFYREVSIWRTGDYAHAVVGRDKAMSELSNNRNAVFKLGFGRLWNKNAPGLSRRQRNKIVQALYSNAS
jgi:hypothetical protein